MADNSNPQGTGTDTDALSDEGLAAFLGESEQTNPDEERQGQDAKESADDENLDGNEAKPTPEDSIVTLPSGEEITWGELQKRMMLQEDYTRKTQTHSEKEKVIEAKIARTTEQARLIEEHQQQLATAFANVEEFLHRQLPPKPDPRLIAVNPQQYFKDLADFEEASQKATTIASMRFEQLSALQQKAEENRRTFMALEAQKLEEAFPQLRGKPDKIAEFHANNKAVLKPYGIEDKEYDGLPTAGKRIIARLAYLEAREKAKSPTAQGQAQAPTPGARVQPRTQANALASKTVQAFRQSGSASAAKAALDSGAFDNFLK